MKKTKTHWALNLLLPFYILMRYIKAPLFNASVPNFHRWKTNNESIILDFKYFAGLSFIVADFYFFKWYWALILLFIVFLFKLALNFKKD